LSTFVVAAATALMLAVAVPASAAPADNPFVGSWETVFSITDSSFPPEDIHFTIGGSGHIQGRFGPSATCFNRFGDLMSGSGSGWGSVVSEDPYILEAYVDVYCYPRRSGGRQLVYEGFYMKYQYDSATDTLKALHFPPAVESDCFWRSGSDPSVCPD
jgi:hypothetical protein